MKDINANKERYIQDEITYLQKKFVDHKINAVKLSYDALEDYIWYFYKKSMLWKIYRKNFIAVRDKAVLFSANTAAEIIREFNMPREDYTILCIDPNFDSDDACLLRLYPEEALFNILY